jgi:very-short-patch-repair endonuclease
MINSRHDTIISEIVVPCIVINNSNIHESKIPPACGGLGGKVLQSKTVSELQPGIQIFDLDNNALPIKQSKSEHYNGIVMEITLDKSNQIHYLLPENLVLCQRKTTKLSPTGHWDDIPAHHFQKARQLRQQTTPPEKRLWQYLRSKQLGIKFRSQHPINRYIVDFYARKAGLVVEVDGEMAHTYPGQVKHDRERDKFMEGLGLKVLRFSASDVMSNIEGVISEIEYHTQEAVLDNFTSGQWRYAKNIQAGDKIFIEKNLNLCKVIAVQEVEMDCDVTILELDGGDNFISDCFVFHI